MTNKTIMNRPFFKEQPVEDAKNQNDNYSGRSMEADIILYREYLDLFEKYRPLGNSPTP